MGWWGVDILAAASPGAALTKLSGERYLLEGGLEIEVVSRPAQLQPALERLRASAEHERHVAIDLEWRPDFQRWSNNPVALIQLSTASLCVLIRACKVGFPQELRTFLRRVVLHVTRVTQQGGGVW